MQKVFTNGNGFDRPILIIIKDNIASFYFKYDYDNQAKWVAEMEEMGVDLAEDEKTIDEFYWIPKDRWEHPSENYPQHMEDKNWFTPEMLDFLNENL